MLTKADVDLYLSHIGVKTISQTPNLADLQAIHKAHVCRIPFNNLITVHDNMFVKEAGFQPALPQTEPNRLMQMLVHSKRGGYCFQQNALLAAVLRALGYDLYDAAARVLLERPSYEPSNHDVVALKGFNHQVILLRGPEDGRWRLVDAGYGGITPTHPILLQAPSSDAFTGDLFRVRPGVIGSASPPTALELQQRPHAVGWYLQRYSLDQGCWQDQYFFTEAEMLPADFAVMNFATAMQPTSFFYHGLMMGIQRPDGGRVTLVNDALKIFQRDGSVEEKTIASVGDFLAALALFGMEAPSRLPAQA